MAYRVLFVESYFDPTAREYLESNDCELTIAPLENSESEDEVIQAVKGFDAVIAGGEIYSERVIGALDGLKIIARKGVGFDRVDLEAAKRAGILVTNTPGATSRAVAEMTIAMMFSLLRRLPRHDANIKNGIWDRTPTVSELRTLTIGIVGMGHIGSEVIKLLKPFGASFVAFDKTWNAQFAREHQVKRVSLETLMEGSDFVSIHVSLNPATKGLVSADLLGKMKPTAYLINTSRGPVVDKAALRNVLENNKIAGAGIDVHWTEPVSADDPIAGNKNVIATPMIAYNTRECAARMMMAAAEGVVAALHGRPVKYELTGR